MYAERLFAALILIGIGVIAWAAYNRWSVHRLGGRAAQDALLEGLRPGVPTIVYFTTPFCMPCTTQQQPALAQVQAELGDALQVVKVDATEMPDAADRWGVFSAPTTFVLDRSGRVTEVNRGVASADMLKAQIARAA